MNTTLKSNFPPTKKINRKKKLKVCTQKKKKENKRLRIANITLKIKNKFGGLTAVSFKTYYKPTVIKAA